MKILLFFNSKTYFINLFVSSSFNEHFAINKSTNLNFSKEFIIYNTKSRPSYEKKLNDKSNDFKFFLLLKASTKDLHPISVISFLNKENFSKLLKFSRPSFKYLQPLSPM